MARLIERRGLNQRVVALFPAGAALGEWYPLQNGVQGLLRDNGSIDLRSRVRLTADSDEHVWRIDRVSAKGNERFIGYADI